jgi:hypothetical protein
MEPSPELIAAVYRDKVLAARAMSAEQKLLAGAELFDYASQITMCGIRKRNPAASPSEVIQILRGYLSWVEQWEARA